VGAESVRTLDRLVIRVLREFLENHSSLDFAASTAVACRRFVMREHLLAILAVPYSPQGGAPPARLRPSAFKLPGRGLF